MTVLYGINDSQIFKWRRQYEDGSPTTVASGEKVVPTSELAAADKQIRELQHLLGKNALHMNHCCPRTTINRRLPEHWRVACAIDYQG